MHRWTSFLGGVVVVALVAAGGWWWIERGDATPPPSTATITTLAPPPDGTLTLTITADVADGATQVAATATVPTSATDPAPGSTGSTGSTGPLTSTDPADPADPAAPGSSPLHPLTTDRVSFEVDAPPRATEIQFAVDPTFAGAEWAPLAPVHTVELSDHGVQFVYARVRAGRDGEPGSATAAVVFVDPDWEAATASAAPGARHRASWARLVSPDVLQVRIETGRIVWNGDAPRDALIGRPLDVTPLLDAAGYRLEPSGVTVLAVGRRSQPVGIARGSDDDEGEYTMVHDLFLELSAPLPTSTDLQLITPGDDVEPLPFNVDPTSTRSPAVQVNQLGFEPADIGKTAYVSAWMGDGGTVDYEDSLPFSVVDAATRSVVFEGSTAVRDLPDGDDGDLAGGEVLEAEFSDLTAPGRYELCVAGIGCSAEFVISDTAAWARATALVAKAAYHQRSGVALGQPYSPLVRPRPFHPDDGIVFEEISLTTMDDPETVDRDDRFGEYPGATTGRTIEGAWGGHFDAGDWNSRISHLDYLAVALDLVSMFPSTFGEWETGIPESGDAIPDLLDEGLWDLDLYRRLQHPDGGVPGVVDQGRFGQAEETSWNNTTGVYVYSPDEHATYTYVWVAAQAAKVLEAYDPERAADYAESATSAMTWAEQRWAANPRRDEFLGYVEPVRAAAAASMLDLTGQPGWVDVVTESAAFADGTATSLTCPGPMCSAAWIIARTAPGFVPEALRRSATESIVAHADEALAGQNVTAFRWLREDIEAPVIWGLGPSVPQGDSAMRAFALTGDPKYRAAAVRAASFSLGGNPINTSFVTGLGESPVRFPLIVDAKRSGLPVWPGTPVYGLHDLSFTDQDDWVERFVLEPAGTHPAVPDSPLLMSFFDVGEFPMMNEFTFAQTHALALWTFGSLAAT